MNNKYKFVVMLGVDNEQKARAARFDPSEEVAVRKAAGLMNYRTGIAKTDQAIELAGKLPEGKLFESGLGMAPLVREETFYKLFEHLTFDAAWNSSGIISGTKPNSDSSVLKAANELWASIKVGSTVLCFDQTEPAIFGWSAAIVLSISKDGEKLELRWRDWPSFKPFNVERRMVALLRPDICS